MTTTPTAVTNPLAGITPATHPAQTLSSLDFLKILVAEFKNQDPTSPSDPTQFASQMVQFSNLGQLESINHAVTQPASADLMQAAGAFIGREVITPGNAIGVKAGKATSISYAPTATDSYDAVVFNSAGQQVDKVALGQLPAGTPQTFTWEPASSQSPGTYSVNIVNSQKAAVSGLVKQGVVQSVSLTSGGIALDLGNLVVFASAVNAVAQP